MESHKGIALVTPSHRKDIDQLALLCESIDRYLTGYQRHYLIINPDDDVRCFSQFSGPRRVVIPCSQLLPRWLIALPPFLTRNGRRIWWSMRTGPVHGWHIQQILKIAAALNLQEQRFCFIDSDNVFIRSFNVGAYTGSEQIPLYVDYQAIKADAPLHAVWTRNCYRLLGLTGIPAFPADDYIGNVIVWDKYAVRDMTRAIEAASGKTWQHALCSIRSFSEYLLYGHFVRNSPLHAVAHYTTTESLAAAYWEERPADAAAIGAMVESMRFPKVALCISSYSETSVSTIRDVVGLSSRTAPQAI